ncbi:cytochrome P450 [Mycena rebaudengoi]|nr:cytochrome P450 [Mycena rebaudengoi]
MAPLNIQGAILCASLAFSAAFYHALSRRNRSTLPLPPGPRKLPLVGNLLDIPADLAWEKYMEWSKEYKSDIIHLNLAGQSVIVLSSLGAAEALLEKRSALYSDRQVFGTRICCLWMVILFQIGSSYGEWVDGLGFQYWYALFFLPVLAFKVRCASALMKYGDTWRTNRRLMREGFTPAIYQPLELAATRTLLERLLDSPDAFYAHLRQMTGEIIMSMAYGIDVLPSDDLSIVLANKGVHSLVVALYVSVLVKEVLRWKNVTPIGVPHFLATEDEYRGYRLPAGSIVIGSTWAILHDGLLYPDPYTFKPERFLLDGKLNPAVKDPDCAAFGFGRRICPGRHMGRSSIWITVASILATFNIDKAVDEAGHVIEPTFEYLTALRDFARVDRGI